MKESVKESAKATGTDLPGLLRALRSRNFRLFCIGQAVSLGGMWMQMVAQSWLMYRLTNSATAVAAVFIAQQGPGLFIGPFAGALADRYPKKRMLVFAQSATAVPAFALAAVTIGRRRDRLAADGAGVLDG